MRDNIEGMAAVITAFLATAFLAYSVLLRPADPVVTKAPEYSLEALVRDYVALQERTARPMTTEERAAIYRARSAVLSTIRTKIDGMKEVPEYARRFQIER